MIKKIDHIGVMVKNLEEVLRFYEDALGLKNVHTETLADQGVRVAMLPVGESRIELVEPLGPDTAGAKYLASHGEGIHHVAFEVDDVNATLQDLAGKGATLIDKQARPGAHGKKIAFVHPSSTHGALLEFCQD